MAKTEILMPVIAMCDKCVECPELDIGIAQKEIDVPPKDNDVYITRTYENTIYCKHYERCRLIKGTILSEGKK